MIILKICIELQKSNETLQVKAGTDHRNYCKTTNFSVLLILAILANGIKTLILIPANIYNQSRGRTR